MTVETTHCECYRFWMTTVTNTVISAQTRLFGVTVAACGNQGIDMHQNPAKSMESSHHQVEVCKVVKLETKKRCIRFGTFDLWLPPGVWKVSPSMKNIEITVQSTTWPTMHSLPWVILFSIFRKKNTFLPSSGNLIPPLVPISAPTVDLRALLVECSGFARWPHQKLTKA